MTLLFVASLVAVGLLVLALAAYLLVVIWMLRDVRHTLGLILFGLRAIAHRVEPAGPILEEINEDLTVARDRLRSVAGEPKPKTPPKAVAPIGSPLK